jgi:hypothetical protein
MLPTRICKTSRRFLSLLTLCLAAQQALAGSPSYHQSISVGQDGKPSLQLTNDSDVPITAFVMVEFPSLGMEGRTYSDVYTSPQEDHVIPPKASITRGLSSFAGSDPRKVRAEVRAVIFKDGSSSGDPVWVNAILARRVRLYDRTLSLHDLLNPLVGKGTSREAILDMLREAQADAEKRLPDDDLRVVDTVAFYGAISTLDKNREAPVDVVLKVYLQYLEKRALLLEFSRPDLDHIRTLPVTTPEPLSAASLPAAFQAAAARSSKAPGNPATLPSSCSLALNGVNPIKTTSLTCTDGDGDEVAQSNVYTFEMTFVQYNASTGKDSDVTWSSPANQGPFNTVGVCAQYNDCEDSPEVYYIQGVANGVGCASTVTLPGNCVVDQGQNPLSFSWLLDRYPYPTFSDCDECDTDPDGYENPVSTNAPVSSTQWSFNYACTVSP